MASKFHTDLELVLSSFCPRPTHPKERKWHTLDVRRALKLYLAQTDAVCNTNSMFVNISPPSLGNRMSTSVISAAFRTCIKEAYITLGLLPRPGITAHSTRSAATSAAFANWTSAEKICRAADWSSLSTFVWHYKINTRASAYASFGCWVL